MKKYAIVLFSALLMLGYTTMAQQSDQPKPKKPTVEERVAKMTKDLGLSAAEQTQVTTLLTKQDAEMKQFYKDNSGADKESADYKAKKKEVQNKQDAELKATIGDEKYKKYQEIRKAEREAAKQTQQKP
jgi:hypothetical protein